jgi:hypothetical protein
MNGGVQLGRRISFLDSGTTEAEEEEERKKERKNERRKEGRAQ